MASISPRCHSNERFSKSTRSDAPDRKNFFNPSTLRIHRHSLDAWSVALDPNGRGSAGWKIRPTIRMVFNRPIIKNNLNLGGIQVMRIIESMTPKPL